MSGKGGGRQPEQGTDAGRGRQQRGQTEEGGGKMTRRKRRGQTGDEGGPAKGSGSCGEGGGEPGTQGGAAGIRETESLQREPETRDNGEATDIEERIAGLELVAGRADRCAQQIFDAIFDGEHGNRIEQLARDVFNLQARNAALSERVAELEEEVRQTRRERPKERGEVGATAQERAGGDGTAKRNPGTGEEERETGTEGGPRQGKRERRESGPETRNRKQR